MQRWSNGEIVSNVCYVTLKTFRQLLRVRRGIFRKKSSRKNRVPHKIPFDSVLSQKSKMHKRVRSHLEELPNHSGNITFIIKIVFLFSFFR